MTDPGRPVFLSYASQDAQAAQTLCNALRAASIEVWFDQSELRGGDAWDASIRRQIRTCALFIPVISRNTQARDEGYFRLEWKLAVDRSHLMAANRPFLVPVVIDDTSDQDEQVPDRFRDVQWTRLPTGTKTDAFVAHVRQLLSPDAPTPAATSVRPSVLHAASTGPASTPSTRPSSRSFVRWIVGGLIVLATGYFLADKFLASKHSAPVAETPTTTPMQAESVSDKSIAVLPFTDMSEKHDQEYFADGMAEEILDLLVKIPGLTVIGRTSSFQFKGKSEDLRTIGEKLNAAHVLEGSVRKSGDQVRITAQLINTQTGTHEWSEIYDRQIGDVLKLQDIIAAAVVRELQITVAAGYLNSRSTLKSTDAYDLMLRGRHAADRFDKEGLDEAVTLFQRALDRDATSADAAAELAFAYYYLGADGFLTSAAAFEQARRAAAMALRLDPKCARAHYVLGKISIVHDWDWAAAEREFQQVATLAPGSADGLSGEALLSVDLGRWEDALRQIKAALAQDPLDPNSLWALTVIQARRGHLPEAEAAMRRALDIRSTFTWGHFYIGLVLLARGDRAGALLEMQQETSDEAQQGGLAMAYYALGRKADSDAALARMLKEQTAENAFGIAEVYAFRGQVDDAIHWLVRAYAQRDPGLTQLKVDLPLQSLEADPRFKALLRKMNLPE